MQRYFVGNYLEQLVQLSESSKHVSGLPHEGLAYFRIKQFQKPFAEWRERNARIARFGLKLRRESAMDFHAVFLQYVSHGQKWLDIAA